MPYQLFHVTDFWSLGLYDLSVGLMYLQLNPSSGEQLRTVFEAEFPDTFVSHVHWRTARKVIEQEVGFTAVEDRTHWQVNFYEPDYAVITVAVRQLLNETVPTRPLCMADVAAAPFKWVEVRASDLTELREAETWPLEQIQAATPLIVTDRFSLGNIIGNVFVDVDVQPLTDAQAVALIGEHVSNVSGAIIHQGTVDFLTTAYGFEVELSTGNLAFHGLDDAYVLVFNIDKEFAFSHHVAEEELTAATHRWVLLRIFAFGWI